MNRRLSWTSALAVLLALPVLAQSNVYQQPSRGDASPVSGLRAADMAGSGDTSLTKESVQRQRRETLEAPQLSEAQRRESLERLDQALRFLDLAADFAAQSSQLQREIQDAPRTLAQLEQDLSREPPAATPTAAPETAAAVLQQSLSNAENSWRTAQDEVRRWSAELDTATRRAEIERLRAKAQDELLAVADALQALSRVVDRASAAQRTELQAKRIALAQRVALLDWEAQSLTELAGVTSKQLQLASRTARWYEQNVLGWRALLDRRPDRFNAGRLVGTEPPSSPVIQFPDYMGPSGAPTGGDFIEHNTLLVTRQTVTDVAPELRLLAQRNVELSETREKLAKDRFRAESDLRLVRDAVREQKSDYEVVSEKVQAGLTPAVGLLLRNRRDRLLDTRLHQQRVSYCDTEMQAAQTALLERRDELLGLNDIDAAVAQAARQIRLPAPAGDDVASAGDELLASIRTLLLTRRELLEALLQEYGSYHDTLSDLESETRELLSHARLYATYIDKHVLWMRSEPPFGRQHAERAFRGLHAFNNVDDWSAVVTEAMHNAVLQPSATAFLLAVVFVLFAMRPGTKDRLHKAGELAESLDRASFSPTFTAVLLTLGLSILWPLCFWTPGWWMSLDPNASELTLVVGRGLRWMSLAFFNAEVIRHTCRRAGLASKHFGWNSATLRDVYASLTWLMMLGLPLVIMVCVLQTYQAGLWRDSLGRASLVFGLAALALGMQHLMHPRRGPIQIALAESRFVWLHQFRHVWYAMAVGVPLALGVLSLMGYTYTAQQLMHRVLYTSWLVLALFLTYALLARAASVAFRQLEGRPVATNDGPPRQQDDERCRRRALEDASVQIHQLLRGGVWLALLLGSWVIWSGVFPVIDWLDRAGPSQLAAFFIGAGATAEVGVTWMDLGLTGFVVLVTAIAVKTLPGILELVVLQRLPLDQGARYAVVILSRYLMALLGAVVVCHTLGVTWSSVQWLVAALTVGLGFGLKDVFANIVSGFIVLLERPVRMGDYVTVAGIDGRISRIQVRATTITDQDNRELVVPNRKMITEELVNWTLSDSVTRVVVPICVSLKSDPQIVEKLLLKLARDHASVVQRPQPSAVLVRIAEQGLHLELRAYVEHRENAEQAINDLNVAIRQEFNRQGIELAGRTRTRRAKAA